MDHLTEVLTGVGVGALLTGALALVCWFLGMGLRRPPVVDAQSGATTLHLKALVRSVGIVGGLVMPLAVLLGGLLSALSGETQPAETLFVVGAFVALLVMTCGPMLVAGYCSRLVISAEGLTHYPWRGLPTHFRWEELTGVTYSKLSGRYTIHVSPGRQMHLSALYDGLPLLFEAVEQYCTPAPAEEAAESALASPAEQPARTSESGVLS